VTPLSRIEKAIRQKGSNFAPGVGGYNDCQRKAVEKIEGGESLKSQIFSINARYIHPNSGLNCCF
jgi:hypothetical protein